MPQQIELKLVEVNGQPVSQNLKIASQEINYFQIALPASTFGSKSHLEVYPDKENVSHTDRDGGRNSIHIIINSPSLRSIVIDLSHLGKKLSGKVRVENQRLYRYLMERKAEIEKSLLDNQIETADIDILALQGEVGFYRKKWMGAGNLDIRA